MAIYRGNPLPVGRYWVDVIGPEKASQWAEYTAANRGALRVISTAHHEASGGIVAPSAPARDFVVFDVISPVQWPHDRFPSPNVATAATTEESTVQRPDPEPSIELPSFGSIAKGAERTATIIVSAMAVGIGLGALALVLSLRKRQRR